MSWEEQGMTLDLDKLPSTWDGVTKEGKVQVLIDVINEQLTKVRCGKFDSSKGDRVAALVLECQLAMSDFYADVEERARNAKHHVEFVENDVQNILSKTVGESKKLSETALKRVALASSEVQESKKKLSESEREYKKWKYVYEMLREAHILFRNIVKL